MDCIAPLPNRDAVVTVAVWRYEPAHAWTTAFKRTKAKKMLAEAGVDVDNVRKKVIRANTTTDTFVRLDGED